MTIIKIMAVVMLAGSVGISTNKATPSIKQAAPASYDLRVGWFYNAALGYNQLWAYTASGGGLHQQVYFTRESTYYRSFVNGSFFNAEFSWELRIPRVYDNDDYFTLVDGTTYIYNSPDNNISYYYSNTSLARMSVSVNESDYYVTYMADFNTLNAPNGYNIISTGTGYQAFSRVTVANTTYHSIATFAFNSYFTPVVNAAFNGSLFTYISNFYFKLNAASNIEGDDWWAIYNQGVNAGYDAGLDAGYCAGLDAGRLENTAWEDAFTIIKGAVNTVGDVMAIQLFGPITIGTLVSIPLIVGLLFWIIDKWRGS